MATQVIQTGSRMTEQWGSLSMLLFDASESAPGTSEDFWGSFDAFAGADGLTLAKFHSACCKALITVLRKTNAINQFTSTTVMQMLGHAAYNPEIQQHLQNPENQEKLIAEVPRLLTPLTSAVFRFFGNLT